MKTWDRLITLIETTVTIGPASAAGLLVMTTVSLFVLTVRLLSQGYYRLLFSSK